MTTGVSPRDGNALLMAKGIRKRFGGIEALKGVDFYIQECEVVGLVGDNGAGKSTFMKILSGFYVPDAGVIEFQGEDVTGLDTRARRNRGIEMVYQDLALARKRNAIENIFLGRELTRRLLGIPVYMKHQSMKEQAAALVEALGASVPDLEAATGKMSGGQQQTVAIARALTTNPQLIIMDEPTAALAPAEVEHVLDLIRTLRNKRVSVILVSHRLPDVFAVADRITVFRQGRVVADLLKEATNMEEAVSYIVGAKE